MVTLTAPPTTLLDQMAVTPLFEGASVETISRLASQGVTRRFRRGTYLFHQGDEAPGSLFLDCLVEEPPAASALLRALARQVLSQEAFVEDLLYLDLKGRVAKRLLQLVSPSPSRAHAQWARGHF